MHPDQITPEIINLYGHPQIRQVFGQSLAIYPPGHIPHWVIARKLARARLLTDAAESYCQKDAPVSPEDWAKVAEIEGIPESGFQAPTVKEAATQLVQRAKLTEVTFDQDFFETLYAVLQLFATNAAINKTATYPLLEGPPGASKSLVVHVVAALLGIPVFTVTGSDGSADEIKIQLFGGDTADSSDLQGTIKKYIGYGWLQHPVSLKLAAQQLAERPLDKLESSVLTRIAEHERLRENITSYWPGWYPLAATNGCILFLDETNGFRGITTLLTEILENYTRQLHPNFMIMGAINPAGEKHEREPLAPEIRSRLVTLPVKAPSQKSYRQMMEYLFTGSQPAISLPNGKTAPVNVARMLQITIPPRSHSILMKLLTKESFATLMDNLSKAHKAVEDKLEGDGILNPKHAALDGCLETRSVDRRLLVRTINAINVSLVQAMEQNNDMVGKTLSWKEYQSAPRLEINAKRVTEAIYNTFVTFYFKPFDFPIQEEIKVGGQKKTYTSAREIVEAIFDMQGLSKAKMLEYLRTTEDLAKFRAAWVARFKTTDLHDATQEADIVTQAVKGDFDPENELVVFLKNTTSEQVNLCDVSYMAKADTRKKFREQNYPNLMLSASTNTPTASIIEAAHSNLRSQKRRFISLDELKAIPALYRNLRAPHEAALVLTPLYDPETDKLRLLVNLPKAVLPEDMREPYKAVPMASKYAELFEGGNQITRCMLKELIEGLFLKGAQTLDIAHIKEEVVLELSLPL